jgi:predicted aspartyl protease|tara:strand:+ start:1437 stop:2474 length:1038 start_codon:yes stop_codon:yes gene_type:complete
MQNKTLFLILLNICFLAKSNSQETKCTETLSSEIGNYLGCLDYEGNLNGYGIMTYSDGDIYEGNWIRNKLDGFGKMTFASNGGFYEGSWENNQYEGQGVLKRVIGAQVQRSEGMFANGKLLSGLQEIDFESGISSVSKVKNNEVIERKLNSTEYIQISFGEHYSNDQLKNGNIKRTYQNNTVTESEVSNGVETETKNNTKNYYNKEDIIGEEDSITINLEKEGNSMHVNLEFPTQTPTEPVRFIFDTGASVFSIGYRLFEYLKKNGLKYDDLGIVIPTVGVRGEPTNNMLIKIHEIKIGSYTIKNIVAYVKTLETANMSLLGVSFMKKFSEVQWSLNSDELIFHK